MALSLQDRMALLPARDREAWLAAQPDYIIDEILRGEWWWTARPEQIPPDGGWFICLALAGRGWGKSRSGSEWIVERVVRHPFDSSGAPTEWLVIAETLSDARTICMEGPAGILRVLDRRQIKYRYKMSPRPMVLFPDGAKIYTEGADDPDVGRGYNASGAWLDEVCIAKDEPVLTERGLVPIQSITTKDRVLTRGGWQKVKRTGLTRHATQVLEIRTTTGTVRLTPEHKVFSNGRWVRAERVKPGDTLLTWLDEQQIQLPASTPPTRPGMERPGTSTSGPSTTSTGPACSSIEHFGVRSTGQSLTDTRSTTSTRSVGTTDWKIWSASPDQIIGGSPLPSETMFHGKRARLQKQYPQDSLHTGSVENPAQSSAAYAASPITARECGPSTALPNVGLKQGVGRIKTRVIAVVKVPEPVDVYDLTVEGGWPEFYAGPGQLLVHNCKWKKAKDAWEQGIMPSLRADLIGDHPRAFVTTTPKPLDLLKQWVTRDDGTVHVIRGSTFENSGNLSRLVLAELKRRYEGTAVGKQELDGEILEAFEGALFNRLDIINNRVYDMPDDIVATVVGVDPSLTGEDDEMGIVVACRDREKHMYILADRSFMGVGRQAALEAWRVVAEYGADKLVVEENLGKRWMQQVFNDAYYELVGQNVFPEHTKPPLVRVDAKLGKRTRGEPVAMRCEQGRLHMLGDAMTDLEDQMATFTAWGARESPDRLDALVHACRWLMDGEKKEARISSPVDALSTTLRDLLSDSSSYRF